MAKTTSPGNGAVKEIAVLKAKIGELEEKNRELEETLEAIRSGEVDAIVVANGDGQKIYTLEGADHPYRALVENIREGALTLSRTGMILYTNSRFAEMAKLPVNKVAGSPLLDLICPDYRPRMELALKEILNQPCRSRVRIHQGKGSLPVYLSMSPLSRDENTKISVVVTDRRKDEERLRMQARMLDSVGDAVIAADMHNKIIYWNDAATKLYGWEPEEALGRDLIEVATPEISHKDAREIADRLKKGETWTGEYIVRHRDGHEFPIYASDAPIFDDDRKLIAIIGASHDISDRKRAEEKLRKSEEKFRSVLDNALDVVYRVNLTTGRFEYISPSAGAVVGFSAEELKAQNKEDALAMIHPDDLPAMKTALSRAEKNGRAEAEYRQRTKTDDYRWLSNHITLIRDSSGRPLYRDGTIRDITESKQAQDELKRKHDDLHAAYEEITATQEELRQNVEELTSREHQLNEALAEKEVLLSEIHHRVKNNLTAFISLLSLEGSYEDTPSGKALKTDLQNRARTMALIHETLYKTRQYADVDMELYLSTLVDQVINSYSSSKSVKTVIDAKGVTLDLARATPTGLIINELVTNSLKYAFTKDAVAGLKNRNEPCTIGIRIVKEDGMFVMNVWDNGVGLSKDFDPAKTQTLGLKLVNFLAWHQLRSKPEVHTDKGTEFVFRFKE